MSDPVSSIMVGDVCCEGFDRVPGRDTQVDLTGCFQRRGVVETTPANLSPQEHLQSACERTFPLSAAPGLPADVIDALAFQAEASVGRINQFWDDRERWLASVLSEVGPNTEWRSAPQGIRSLASRIHTPLLRRLLSEFHMGGESWVSHFVTGFPLVGKVSYPGLYPCQNHDGPALSLGELEASAPHRFAELSRILQDSEEDVVAIWESTIEEAEAGWLSGPFSLEDLPEGACVPARRFLVKQRTKLRPCDNFRRSMANAASSVTTPVVLPGIDHATWLAQKLIDAGKGAEFAKADHASAYRQLPLDPRHAQYGLIAVREPVSRRIVFFLPRALMFGSTTAVAHYNSVSRVVASLCARIFMIPSLGYFDDFLLVVPRGLAPRALRLFGALNEALGFSLKNEKSAHGSAVEFLGIVISSSPSTVTVAISADRRTSLRAEIAQAIESGFLRRDQAESLAGKLSFAQFHAFGRCGRAFLPRLYARSRYGGRIGFGLASDLIWWRSFLSADSVRPVLRGSPLPDAIVYTDAAGDGGLGAVSLLRSGQSWRRIVLCGVASQQLISSLAADTNAIYALETLAVLRAVRRLGASLAGRSVMFYVDNDAALCGIMRGYGACDAVTALIHGIWSLLASSSAVAWFERVRSSSNPADLPSRTRPDSAPSVWLSF